MDGITMGGGMGLAQGCSMRIVTEHAKLAMPETHIGLFPDVGGGWFLAQAPGHLGEFLGLTGHVLGAADALAVGWADACVKAERLDALVQAIADPSASVVTLPPPPVASPASPLRKDVMDAVTAAVHQRYPSVTVVPGMSAGASDSMYFRNAGIPSYGVNAAFTKPDDTFAHGLNERLPASELAAGLDFWHTLLTRLAR
jgi:enoyl-CoA hydratase/carnithine racemase